MSVEPGQLRCPLCKRPAIIEFKPFCSRGCRDRDLNAWLGDGYRIAVDTNDDETEKSSDYGVDSTQE